MTTTDTFFAAFLVSSGTYPIYEDETEAGNRRWTFEDNGESLLARKAWREWTGGNFRTAYKSLKLKAIR